MSTARSFLGFLGLFPLALFSAAACGGNAFENRYDGVAGSSSAGSGASSPGGGGSAAGGAIGSAGASSGGTENVDVSSCTTNTQCQLRSVSCCSCGASGGAANFTAINSAYDTQFEARCGTIACAPCPPGGPPGLDDPSYYLVATCQRPADAPPTAAGHCVVVDLRATEITACTVASDCSLRADTTCCSGCSNRPVALNSEHTPELAPLVCDSDPGPCGPGCAPSFDGFAATCNEGRCSVESKPCSAMNPCTL